VLALAAAVADLIFLMVTRQRIPERVIDIAAPVDVIAMAAAAAALFARALPLRYFVLGMWAISFSWAAYDIAPKPPPGQANTIDIPGYSSAATWQVDKALVAAAIAIAAVALLVIAFGRSAERDRLPGPFGMLLFVVAVVSHGAWDRIVYTRQYWDPYLFPPAPREASAVVAVAVTAVVAWYALTLRDRRLGGALLLGWYAQMAFGFLTYLIARVSAGTASGNIVVGVLGAIGITLTIVYWLGRRSAAPSSARMPDRRPVP
jgi:hypothetical protein